MIKNTLYLGLLTATLSAYNTFADDPHAAKSHYQQALQHQRQGNTARAIEQYQKTIACNPYHFGAHFQLGFLAYRRHDYAQAATYFKKAFSIYPRSESAAYNLGRSYHALGQIDQAITYYTKVSEITQKNKGVYDYLGRAYITLGDFDRGFQAFNNLCVLESTKTPNAWDGSDPAGKTMLLRHTTDDRFGGFGDTLQYIRFAKDLKERGAMVVVEVKPALIHLLSCCNYIDKLIPRGTQLPSYDAWINLVDIPGLLKPAPATLAHTVPYLKAKKELVDYWRTTINAYQGYKVGLCWKGSSYNGDARALTLEHCKKLTTLEGVTFFSLQKFGGRYVGLPSDTKATLHDFGPSLDTANGSFMDTAAIMVSLDLVITVDTSIAHLAGGLGIPVWILLPQLADWRWMQNRTDSPWYPTMRLFRQPSPGDWESVINIIHNELRILLNEKDRT